MNAVDLVNDELLARIVKQLEGVYNSGSFCVTGTCPTCGYEADVIRVIAATALSLASNEVFSKVLSDRTGG